MSLIDKKIEKYGYHKTEENYFGAIYEKYVREYNYTSVIAIMRKASGKHIVQCYDKEVLNCDGNFVNSADGIAVGLLPILCFKVFLMKHKYKW